MRYFDWISALSLTCFTPALKPASNLRISGRSTPPTKPTLSFLVFRPAAAPTRKEPSCSAKSRLAMLAPVACGSSTMANWMSAYSFATFFTATE